MLEIKKITTEEASEIIEKREPRGLFYTIENGTYVGIDNRTGDAWTEDFKSLSTCKRWLTDGEMSKEEAEGMRAITLWQPWAQLIVIGAKRVETRGRKTNIRGRVAIHAAKADKSGILMHIPMSELEYFQNALGPGGIDKAPHGAIVGTAEIIDCIPAEDFIGSQYDTPQERAFGDYSPGRWAWILKDPVLFEKPAPAKGGQGFWNWKEAHEYGQV